MQKQKQISVPQQHRENRDYVLTRGGLLVREMQDEAISGETLDRPQLQEMLAWARAGALAEGGATLAKTRDKDTKKPKVLRNAHFDVLLVWKLDRLSRPDEDLDLDFLLIRKELRLCGVRIESTTEPWIAAAAGSDGAEMAHFMGYLGRGQTNLDKTTREARFRLGREGMAEGQGRQNGPPPYGYDWADPPPGEATRAEVRKGRSWQPIEPGATWVRAIYDWFLAGYTVNAITALLNARGALPPSQSGDGGRRRGAVRHDALGWTHDSVARILRNKRYAGFVFHAGQWHSTTGADGQRKPGGHPPLISLSDWERAQDILAGRGSRRAAGAISLFAGGLLRCPLCHEAGEDTALFTGTSHHKRPLVGGGYSVHKYLLYQCGRHRKTLRLRRFGLAVPPCDHSFTMTENRLLSLLTAYLQRLARRVDPAALAEALERLAEGRGDLLSPRPEQGRAARAAQRAELEKQLAQIPQMETNFQMQQALGHMTMEKLGEMLRGLSERAEALRAALDELAEDKGQENVLPPVQAALLLHLLADPEAAPDGRGQAVEIGSEEYQRRRIKKRDLLRAVFEKIIPGADRKSLRVYLK